MARYSRGTRGRARARQSARTGALEVFIRPDQTILGLIVGWLIRLRAEIFVIICITLCSLWLASVMSAELVSVLLISICVLVLGVPGLRRYVTRRVWCVVTRHRVRACFQQTRTMTHNGKSPSLLWSRPTPVGERVRVWLPAGLSVNDLERVAENIAVACWADSARIERGKRAFLASILIMRRDSLGTRDVSPDVLGRIDSVAADEQIADVVPLPRREDVLTELKTRSSADVAEPIEHTKPTGRGGTKKPRNDASETDPAARGFGGMDVSDYV